ncbi:MAG: PIN domain-containing protein [Ktedonobacteraceae bacterium]
MGWVDLLRGSKVGLDTAPLIYFTEENPKYIQVVDPFFEALRRGEFTVVTSTVTLLETLVNPIKQGNTELAKAYRNFLFRTRGVTIISLDRSIAEEAARLRAFHKIRTPDSIQMATAIKMNATYFLTNDSRLPSIPELKIITLDELKTRPEYLTPDNLQ